MYLLFKNYSFVEVIYMSTRFNKTKSFLRKVKSTDTNGVNEQNSHSFIERKITLERLI